MRVTNIKALLLKPSEALIDILKPLFTDFYFTTIKNGFFYLFSMKDSHKLLQLRLPHNKSISFLLVHIAYFMSILKVSKKVSIIILSQVSDYPLLSMFLGKLMGKKIIDFIGGSRIFLFQLVLQNKTTLFRKMASLYGIISLVIAAHLVDRIVLISNSLISEEPFIKFKNKVQIALNFPSKKFYDSFNVKKKLAERDFIIGYVGAFTRAKGVYNLALAIKSLIVNNPQLKVLFVGNWQNSEPPFLGKEIRQMFKGYDNVIFTGPVPHEKVAHYLNEMRLLVLPSYSEGFPHVMLEAMACGTPVLATPVGAIPNVIKDGETSFLLKSNDPRHMAEKIVELLNRPELLEKISNNSYKFIRENFSYEKTLEAWRKILGRLR